jgi:uncharacterized protein YjbI with pentapeptide repeats
VFEDASLKACDFSAASLDSARFQGCHLKDCDFRSSRAATLRFHTCSISGAKFSFRVLDGAYFEIVTFDRRMTCEDFGVAGSEAVHWRKPPFFGDARGLSRDVEARLKELGAEFSSSREGTTRTEPRG